MRNPKKDRKKKEREPRQTKDKGKGVIRRIMKKPKSSPYEPEGCLATFMKIFNILT